MVVGLTQTYKNEENRACGKREKSDEKGKVKSEKRRYRAVSVFEGMMKFFLSHHNPGIY